MDDILGFLVFEVVLAVLGILADQVGLDLDKLVLLADEAVLGIRVDQVGRVGQVVQAELDKLAVLCKQFQVVLAVLVV